jgi:hypothetical protein
MYVFRVPVGTTYWSQGAVVNGATEVAFEYVIESSDIVEYWAPSKDYILKAGEAPNPRKKFQASNWDGYLHGHH